MGNIKQIKLPYDLRLEKLIFLSQTIIESCTNPMGVFMDCIIDGRKKSYIALDKI